MTSVVIGNCGFGFAPVKPERRERAMLTMTRTEAIPLASMKAAMPWDWETYPAVLDTLERLPKGVNVLPYVPINPLLGYVMGIEAVQDRPHADRRRAREMRRICSTRRWTPAHADGRRSACSPTVRQRVQRDYDGSPMDTDVMHDETCIEMRARCSVSAARASRN